MRKHRLGWGEIAILILAVLLALMAWQAYQLYRLRADNRLIQALVDGQDIAAPETASPEALFARAAFLLARDRDEEASALFGAFQRQGGAKRRASFLYNLANAKLRRAFDLVGKGQLDNAAPAVAIAKDLYRQALRLEPHFWNAKYNLEVAMGVIRDLPQASSGREENEQLSKKLWTDVPGFPSGLP